MCVSTPVSPCPGKCLRGRQDEILLIGVRAFDERLHLRRHGLGVLAERTDVDDRVIRVVVDVRHRIVDPLHAQRARLARRDLAFEARVRRDRPPRRTPWRAETPWCRRPAWRRRARNRRPPCSGTLARRCMRLRNAATAYGSAFWITRPLDQFTRISPPTLVSRISRTNLRYSRERELGAAPWKAMKTNCATSSRRVMPLHPAAHRRGSLERRGRGFVERLSRRSAGGAAADRRPPGNRNSRNQTGERNTTFQCDRFSAMADRACALVCGPLLRGGRFARRSGSPAAS